MESWLRRTAVSPARLATAPTMTGRARPATTSTFGRLARIHTSGRSSTSRPTTRCRRAGATCSRTRDHVDIWTIGTDTYFGKKFYFTTYYSLSAGRGNVFTHPRPRRHLDDWHGYI